MVKVKRLYFFPSIPWLQSAFLWRASTERNPTLPLPQNLTSFCSQFATSWAGRFWKKQGRRRKGEISAPLKLGQGSHSSKGARISPPHLITQARWSEKSLSSSTTHHPSETQPPPRPVCTRWEYKLVSERHPLMDGWRGRNRRKSIQIALTQFNLTKSHDHKGSSRQTPTVTPAHQGPF